jgi:hypothetical protein
MTKPELDPKEILKQLHWERENVDLAILALESYQELLEGESAQKPLSRGKTRRR